MPDLDLDLPLSTSYESIPLPPPDFQDPTPRSISPTSTVYSSASSRTESTNYGIYARRMALSEDLETLSEDSSQSSTPSTPTPPSAVTPSLVGRSLRHGLTLGVEILESRTSKHERLSSSSPLPSSIHAHTYAHLRIHHGAIDQTALTTRSPPEVMPLVRNVLKGMGIEMQNENEYKVRCIRVKKKAGSDVRSAASSVSVDERSLSLQSSSSFTLTRGSILLSRLVRRQAPDDDSHVNANSFPSDDGSLGVVENAGPVYGDRSQDPGGEVQFSIELTRIDQTYDLYSLDIRRLKGNLRSYKFLYDTFREYVLFFA